MGIPPYDSCFVQYFGIYHNLHLHKRGKRLIKGEIEYKLSESIHPG